jgi:hypothetical protein
MEVARDPARSARGQLDGKVRPGGYWTHKNYVFWFFSDTNRLIYRALRHQRTEVAMHGSTRLEHALFALTLAAMAYLSLETLALAAQVL